ncbi:MAG: TonB-dependent receptor, partial [Nitrospirae bacterium]|nr:TonB-dependent receptor [Nitrospirota bacterium]
VTIYTSGDIRKYGFRTIGDLLKTVMGFYVSYDRIYQYLGTRGFNLQDDLNDRFLMLVDGHKINDYYFGQAYIGTDALLDLDLIDKIEIIRGPGSSLYGNNAFLGIINIITRNGRDISGAELSGSVASFQTYSEIGTYGKNFDNGLDIVFSASGYKSRGQNLFFKEFDTPESNNGIAGNGDSDRNRRYFSKIKFNDFTLESAYVSRTRGMPAAPYNDVFNNPDNKGTDTRSFVELKYDKALSETWLVMGRAYYDYYNNAAIFIHPNRDIEKYLATSKLYGSEIKLVNTSIDRNKLIFGVEYDSEDRVTSDSYTYEGSQNSDNRYYNGAVYAQDEFRISDNLLLNAGLRYDYYKSLHSTLNPRISLIYKPSENTNIKLIYGTAFRAPSEYETIYGFGKLTPETITMYELVVERHFREFTATFSTFVYKVEKIIEWVPDAVNPAILDAINEDTAHAKGFEFEISRKLIGSIDGSFSYTYQDNKDSDTRSILTNSPRHLAKLNLTMPVSKDKIFVSADTQFTSSRKTLQGNYAEGYFMSNLTLYSRNIVKGLEASASIYNIFNKKYSDPGLAENVQDLIEQDGRNFRVKLTYRF